jgi:hypothetical protein
MAGDVVELSQLCGVCKQNTVNKRVCCAHCGVYYHLSCAAKLEHCDSTKGKGYIVCCDKKEIADVNEDALFLDATSDLPNMNELSETNLLKIIISNKNLLIRELYGKIDLLNEKIAYLQKHGDMATSSNVAKSYAEICNFDSVKTAGNVNSKRQMEPKTEIKIKTKVIDQLEDKVCDQAMRPKKTKDIPTLSQGELQSQHKTSDEINTETAAQRVNK